MLAEVRYATRRDYTFRASIDAERARAAQRPDPGLEAVAPDQSQNSALDARRERTRELAHGIIDCARSALARWMG